MAPRSIDLVLGRLAWSASADYPALRPRVLLHGSIPRTPGVTMACLGHGVTVAWRTDEVAAEIMRNLRVLAGLKISATLKPPMPRLVQEAGARVAVWLVWGRTGKPVDYPDVADLLG